MARITTTRLDPLVPRGFGFWHAQDLFNGAILGCCRSNWGPPCLCHVLVLQSSSGAVGFCVLACPKAWTIFCLWGKIMWCQHVGFFSLPTKRKYLCSHSLWTFNLQQSVVCDWSAMRTKRSHVKEYPFDRSCFGSTVAEVGSRESGSHTPLCDRAICAHQQPASLVQAATEYRPRTWVRLWFGCHYFVAERYGCGE